MSSLPRVVVKLNVAKSRPDNFGSFKLESEYENGDVGFVVIPAAAQIKLKQAYKQILVLGIEGASVRMELPGVTFEAYPRVKITSYWSRKHQPRNSVAVGWIEFVVWADGIELVMQDPEGYDSCTWDVTDQLQEVRSDVVSRFNTEKEKRKEWLSKYVAAGRKPIMDLPGAKRGRHKKEKNTESV